MRNLPNGTFVRHDAGMNLTYVEAEVLAYHCNRTTQVSTYQNQTLVFMPKFGFWFSQDLKPVSVLEAYENHLIVPGTATFLDDPKPAPHMTYQQALDAIECI